jgi:hypothetical protein
MKEKFTDFNRLSYESKCKKCGELSVGIYETKNGPAGEYMFEKVMNEKMKSPFLHKCLECQKQTVHELVSFGNKWDYKNKTKKTLLVDATEQHIEKFNQPT